MLDFAAFLAQRVQASAQQEWHDLQAAQTTALHDVWDNPEDEVWNDAWNLGSVALVPFSAI